MNSFNGLEIDILRNIDSSCTAVLIGLGDGACQQVPQISWDEFVQRFRRAFPAYKTDFYTDKEKFETNRCIEYRDVTATLEQLERFGF